MATQHDVAKHLGVSQKLVADMVAQGTISKKGRGQYDLDECRNEYISHIREIAAGRAANGELDLVAERARLAKEQADAKEMENDIERGSLVYIEDVASSFEKQLEKVKVRMLAIPTKLAPECAAAVETKEVRILLEVAILEALNELVGYDQGETEETA